MRGWLPPESRRARRAPATASRNRRSCRLWLSEVSVQTLRRVGVAIAAGAVAFLALYHLSAYPLTWFDEGSHLHVPKTLLRHGVYADYSSDGYRYFGPTLGVGPTVLLPVAAVFRLFGVGLLQ